MTSVIVHNIRNPLAAIRSSAELMLDDTAVQAVQPQVEGIITEVDQLENWLRQLLTYARPLSYTPTEVQLSTMLQDIHQRYASVWSAQDIHLTLDMVDSLPTFSGDAILIQQALDSLVSNALEAMPQGGTLTVHAALSPDKRSLQVQISDTGYGMTTDTAAKALRPFFTTKQRGGGIGLSLVKRIMECHAGTIGLRSTPGRGTTVTLAFPLRRKTPAVLQPGNVATHSAQQDSAL
jgi:signal transduction histidine kinase